MRTRARRGLVTVARMALDRTRTLRGALAGAAAAGVWAAQQPLDKRVFGVDYDDAELLGKPRHARAGAGCPVGLAHARRQRRAVRRRLRERRAARCPVPAGAARRRSPGWPSTSRPGRRRSLLDRLHPARDELPAAVGQPARVRPGDLAPPAVRRRARRARAAAEPARADAPARSTPPPSPPTATARAEHLGRRRRAPPERASSSPARRGFAGGHLAAACAAAGDDVVDALARAAGVDLLDAGGRARGGRATREPDVVYHLAARAHVGESWREPAADAARQRRDDAATCSRPCAREAPEARRGRRSAPARSTGRRRRCRSTRTRRCARRTPTRSRRRAPTCWPASTPTRTACASIRARAFNHAGPGQEPIYAIASFARQVAAGLEAGDDPVRVVTGNPDTRRDFTDVRDVVRAYRLLAARGRAGRLQRLLGPHRARPRELRRRARPRSRASAIDHEVDPTLRARARGAWRCAARTSGCARRPAGSRRSRSSGRSPTPSPGGARSIRAGRAGPRVHE